MEQIARIADNKYDDDIGCSCCGKEKTAIVITGGVNCGYCGN